ncbi:hypothetical protein F53441_10130 [Fusarium austroafricanum]|uniref:Heterokaryon incompatibility domain-containing protein n=1 Tax=Fusarium austroafricanum TaxID=2364996 RepID=A0A8H4KBY1_9HYPO|nr:hypothetical protein F53441_10130 [Fusarium austroafricanum]
MKIFQEVIERTKNDQSLNYLALELDGHGSPDEWIFRLVRRGDSADGFLVISNSKNRRRWHVVGSFGFCVKPEESKYFFALSTQVQQASPTETIRGAKASPDAGAENTLELMRGWIHDCVQNHDACIPPKVQLPSRVLDLGAFDDHGKARLLETHGQESSPCVALSYCWGSDATAHVRTTHSTISEHLDSIDVDKLPQTYKDAIKITRHLGLRYLWIDSLCICQDDPEDWAREAASMQRVYAGAYVTIAADKAARCTDGFLTRREREYIPTKLKITPSSDTDSKSLEISAYTFNVPADKTFWSSSWLGLDGEPLTSRAWATQERLLPQRIVHFAADAIFFECNCHFISEGGVEVSGRWNSVYPGVEKGFTEMARVSRVGATHKLWYLIMDDYTGRALTVKTDRFPAISGLAALIKHKLNNIKDIDKSNTPQATEYVAGLWSDALIEGLGWSGFDMRGYDREDKVLPDTRPLPKEGGYIAPTWSPASFDGRSANGMRDHGWVDVATVLNFNVTLKNKQNPFGEVVDGSITLRAPMIKVQLSNIPDEREATIGSNRRNMRFCTPRGPPHGTVSLFGGIYGQSAETRDWVKNNDIFVLILSEGKYVKRREGNMRYHGLLIMPVPKERRMKVEGEEFRRVGTIFLDAEDLGIDEEIVHDIDRFKEVVII